MDEKSVVIKISAKNLTAEEFDKARKQLVGVTDDTKKASGTAKMLGDAFKALAPALSVGAVVGAFNAYADFTGMLTDLSAKTGIGVEALQRLKYAAEQNGGTLEQVTGAITKLGSSLAGGDASAMGALKALGLSFESIRKMAPDQAFTAIADAIAKVPDPMAQSKLAMDLFGKSGADLLPMMKGNMSETAAAAERLGLVLSEEAVAAGDEFGDTMDTLMLVGKSLIAQVLEPMVPVLTTVAHWLGEKLPGAVKFIRDALSIGLARAWIDAKILFNEFILGVAEGINKIPLLGEKIGFSSETIAGLRSNVQHAKDQLALFTQETIVSTASNEVSAKTIANLNLNYAANEKAAAKAAAAQEKFRNSVQRLDTSDFFRAYPAAIQSSLAGLDDLQELLSRTTDETGQLNAETLRWAQANGAVLAPSIARVSATATGGADDVRSSWATAADVFRDVVGILGQVKGKFFDVAGIAVRTGESIFRNLSSGDAMGAVVSGIGGAVSLIGKLFSNENTEQVRKYNEEIKKVQETLLEEYGTMDDLEKAANRVGLSFKENWGHQGKAGLEATNKLMAELERRTNAVGEASGRAISGFAAVVTGITAPWLELGEEADEAAKKAGAAWDKLQEAIADGKSGDALKTLREEYAKAFAISAGLHDRLFQISKGAEQQLADLGVQAVATFGAAMVAGDDYATALRKVAPSLRDLHESYKALGLDVDDVGLKHLLLQATILEGNPALVDAATGLGSSMQGLAQLGMLNVDTFGAMQRTGSEMYARLQGEVAALGGDTRDALVPMQSYLQQAAAQAHLLGIPLDENTQRLIEQSQELGIWQERGKSAQDLLIEGMTTLVEKVDRLLTQMLGVSGAISGLPDRRDVEINIHENVYRSVTEVEGREPGFDRGTFGVLGTDFPDFGDGTRVTLHNREAVVPYEDRIATALRWLGGGQSAAPAAPVVKVNVLVDKDGTAHQVSEERFILETIQRAIYGGQIDIPRRFISGGQR